MRDLDVLVPSSLVAAAISADLLADVALPTLSRGLARASANVVHAFAGSPLTAWQAWLFGVQAGIAVDAVNIAELWARACGTARTDARRWLVEPAHFQVARDHLRLADPAHLDVTLDEARALAAVVEPILADAGWRLSSIDEPTKVHWLVSRDDDRAIVAPAIDRAIGDNVAAWQPRATGAAGVDDSVPLDWRRCVNEVQMAWYDHPVNEAREARGRPAINTLWLSGNGAAAAPAPRYAAVESGLPLLAALPVDPSSNATLVTFDGLIVPARQEAWAAWLDALALFEVRLADIVRRQADGEFAVVTLAFCGRDHVRVLTLERGDLRRVWRGWRSAPALSDWFAEPEGA